MATCTGIIGAALEGLPGISWFPETGSEQMEMVIYLNGCEMIKHLRECCHFV